MNPYPVMEILHLDEHILVVAKPSGLLAQPDHSGADDVLSRAKQELGADAGRDPFVGLVHRLDRPTSGVMILARTPEAARRLSAQFRERTVEKTYVAVVEGTLRGIGSWSDYVAKPDRQPKIVASDHPDGRYAELDWQVLHADRNRTLLRLQLHTGRPHQIRLQAAERGYPVIGDGRYGASSALSGGAIALHHVLLRVEHPDTWRVETFAAPIPAAWDKFLSDEMREALETLLDRATLND